ncbi:MAG: hypothetical protein QNJ91_05515 [Gammaproteobacteria bacterium]|nr:hypothetical protein [Gammaproteobacteria bacterium]
MTTPRTVTSRRTAIVAAVATALPALIGAAQVGPGYPPPPGPYRSGDWHPPAAAAAPPAAEATAPGRRPYGMLMPDDAADPATSGAFGASNLFGGSAPSTPRAGAPDPAGAAPSAATNREPRPRDDVAADVAPRPDRGDASVPGYRSPATPPPYPPTRAPRAGSAVGPAGDAAGYAASTAGPPGMPPVSSGSAAAPFMPRDAAPAAAPPPPEGAVFRPRADRAN